MRWFVTYTCARCGWSFGPSRKKVVKQMAEFHRQVHRLERDANANGPAVE
jgi:hypothetical protein